MKLIAKSGGVAAISLIGDEVKPLNGYRVQTLIEAVAARYKFAKIPTVEETNASGAKFGGGSFASKNITITELGLFNDAIHVTTTDTADSEVVRLDLFEWLVKQFHFREPTTKPKRAYQSDLIVEFENPPGEAFNLFEPLMQFIQKEVASHNGDKREIEFSRLDLGSDPMVSGANAQFIVERRAGVFWKSNRFFCKAYMPTAAHIKALGLMDKLLGKAKR